MFVLGIFYMAKTKDDNWEVMNNGSVLEYLGIYVIYQFQVQGLSQMELSQIPGALT